MLITFITTLLLIILTILNLKISKDITSPVSVISFVYCVDFVSFIIFAFITKSHYWMPTTSVFFAAGVLVFSIGYYLSIFIINKFINKVNINQGEIKLTLLCKLFFSLELIISIAFFIHFVVSQWNYIDGSILRILNANKINGYSGLSIFYYFRTLVMATYYVVCYLIFYKKYSKHDLIFYIFIFIASLIHLIMNGSRTHLFKILIPTFFIFLMSKKTNKNKTIRLIFLCMAVIVVLTASLTAIMHQPVSIDFLRCYLNSGIVAFSEWAKNPGPKLNGAYTFRIIFAILSKLGLYKGSVSWLEMSTLNVPDIDWGYGLGNVYTFYHGYAKDFGLLYALFIQFIVAFIHGTIYANAEKKQNIFWIVLLEISYFPLVMQFFTDNYFIMLSYWTQVLIIVFIFCKTKLFFKNV